MKFYKMFLIFNFYFLLLTYSYGQSLLLTYNSKPVNDSVINVNVDVYESALIHVNVINQSNEDLTVRVKKIVNNAISGSENTYCWAGKCLHHDSIYSNRMSITAGDTIKDFYGDYNAKGNPGKTSVTYVFITNISDDTAAVTINYNGTDVSVNNIKNEVLFFETFPNPADNVVNIRFSVLSSQSPLLTTSNLILIINDITGDVRSKLSVPDSQLSALSSQFSINTSEYPSGIYSFTLLNKNRKIKSGQLIITH
jgi:hypothetical protein